MIFEKNLEIFWKSCKFFGFSFYRLSFLSKGNDFHEKIHQICWFSGCDFHLKIKKSAEIYAFWTKNLRFFGNSAPFLCSKATIDHAASGWCAAVIFWKKATKFAGFLVVIFTSQSKNLQQFLHSEKILGNFGRFSTSSQQPAAAAAAAAASSGHFASRGSNEWTNRIPQKISCASNDCLALCGGPFRERSGQRARTFFTQYQQHHHAMMSNDEQWWVMNADDADDGCWWWCWWSRKLYKQIAELPINRPTGAEY